MDKTHKIIYTVWIIVFAFSIGGYFIIHNDGFGGMTIQETDFSGIYPNPSLTPGALNPEVTQENIQQTICVSGWTKTIRPPSSYTTALKIKQIKEYGYQDTKTADYEEDHIISLELGGHPTAPENLWPESYNNNPNARTKDATENYLHKEVCAGRIKLSEAQKEIVSDWVAVYQIIKGKLGAVSNDEDDEIETRP